MINLGLLKYYVKKYKHIPNYFVSLRAVNLCKMLCRL